MARTTGASPNGGSFFRDTYIGSAIAHYGKKAVLPLAATGAIALGALGISSLVDSTEESMIDGSPGDYVHERMDALEAGASQPR